MADIADRAPYARTQIPPAETPGTSGLMTLAVGVVVLAALYLGREVFLPIFVAVLLSFVLAPFVDLLRKLRLGRIASVIIATLTAIGIVVSLGVVIGVQVADLASDLPRYQATFRAKAAGLRDGILGHASDVVKDLGREIKRATEEAPAPAPTTAPTTAPAPPEQKPVPVEIREPDPTPLALARQILLPVLKPLATTGIVFIIVVFILMQRQDLRDRMIRLFGSKDLHRTTIAMDDAARRLSRYFLIQLALNAAFGVLVTVGLWTIGVPSPVLWGIFAALMRFVPYVGSFIAAAGPVALAAAVDPGWSMVLWTVALFLVTEPLMGHVIEPLVYGQGTGLSPFAIVVSAIFWTWLWGPVGLILATPFTVCLVVLGRHVERLEFLDVLLGDRPALTPVENFYQRMLAGDPDEALEHAEQLLKERSLSSYYDEVALKALQLAANDAARGVLTARQLESIKEASTGLVSDLADHDDIDPMPEEAEEDPAGATLSEKTLPKEPALPEIAPPPYELPPPWQSEAPVMCIAGRGSLDEAPAAMLAQLLGKHGLDAQVVPYTAVSRSNILSLDVEGVAMICISYLDISGNPAHLRYLLRRLRQRVPDAPILVGLWPADDAVLRDEALRGAIGADHYVTSLREAVAACLEEARRAAERHAQEQGEGRTEATKSPRGAGATTPPEPVAARF
jgi:predicted PurR-regulated permease PerM